MSPMSSMSSMSIIAQGLTTLPSRHANAIRRRKKAILRRGCCPTHSPSQSWLKRPLSPFADSSHVGEGPECQDRHGHAEHRGGGGFRINLDELPSDTDDDDPTAHDPSGRGSVPSTPQGRTPRPRPSLTWSSKSAPAVLPRAESISSTPPRSRKSNRADTSSQAIKDKVIETLQKKLRKTEQDPEKPRITYIFNATLIDDPQRRILKIGETASTGQQRLKRIKAKCRVFSSITQEEDPERDPISLGHRVEQLVHAELREYQFRFICTCGAQHGEYFEVDKPTAMEAVQRWRAFCASEPYDADGNLLPFWVDRLRRLDTLCQRDYRFRALCAGGDSKDIRRMRWQIYTSPLWFDTVRFVVPRVSAKMSPWRWHTLTLVQALVLVFVTFPFKPALAWLVLVLFLIALEMSSFIH
ncbi:hypothetical protein GGR57DRAFT_476215 [Xylariaceae sp. FL1272]|nr:hypothetical protein GGR57DRAFT_476215 [Xylariaceae sp. FL1272]